MTLRNEDKYQILSFHDFNLSNLKNVIRYNPYSWMLIALIIVAFILRFLNLDFNSLWIDEGFTASYAKQSLFEIWTKSMSGGDVNPPLFYCLEHVMMIFGDSEFLLRFPSALLGSLTIPVLYFIGKEINGKLCGIIAACLLTTSYIHIYYSQDARAYSTMLFFFSLAVLLYLMAIRTKSMIYWIMAGIFSALAIWTHTMVFIGVMILFIHSLIVYRHIIVHQIKLFLPTMLMFCITALLCIPILINALNAFETKTSETRLWGYEGIQLINELFLNISNNVIYLELIFVFLAAIGIIYLFCSRKKRIFSLLIILFFIIPILAGIFLSSITPMVPRYLLFILPFYFVAIGSAFSIIPAKKISYIHLSAIILILICTVSISFLLPYYSNYTKPQWKEMSETIFETTNPGDFVVLVPGYLSQSLDYYYNSTFDKTIERYASSVDELEAIEKERDITPIYYIVTSDIMAADPSGSSMKWLDRARIIDKLSLPPIYIFQPK